MLVVMGSLLANCQVTLNYREQELGLLLFFQKPLNFVYKLMTHSLELLAPMSFFREKFSHVEALHVFTPSTLFTIFLQLKKVTHSILYEVSEYFFVLIFYYKAIGIFPYKSIVS